MLASNVVLFDNSTSNRLKVLRRLVHDHDNPLLESFLRQVGSLLRDEVSRQPQYIQDQLPQFANITELIERSHDRNYPILEHVLLCIYQIGSLLLFSGNNSWITSESGTAHILGFETGLLAATAVAVSGDAAELSKLGPLAVALALKLSIHIQRVAEFYNPKDVDSESRYGKMVVQGLSESEVGAVLAQGAITKLPSSRPYIKESYKGSIVVTGILDTLLTLAKLPVLRGHVTLVTSTTGSLDAPYLSGAEDVQEILQGWCGEKHFKARHQKMAISTQDRTIATSKNAYDLITELLRDVLPRKAVFSTLCVTAAAKMQGRERRLLTFGASPALGELLLTLQLEDYIDMLSSKTEPTDMKVGRADKIAIVGYSGRFPGAKDAELLWELLRDGRDVHREIPSERFNIDTHYDETGVGKNTTQTKFGCFVEEPGLFDPRFFNVSPREAFQMDPVQRLALLTAYEALEMAGCLTRRTPSTQNNRIGTFYGQASDDWREVNSGQNVDTYFIPGGIRAFTPGRINYHFKFSGPSYSVDTACSSSFAAIQLACTSLSNGECDTAVTGGVNILTNPDIFAGLSRGYFLSQTGQCKTFDEEADGYCRADGVSSIVLKRLEDAEADNDNILAIILGSKTNHSAEASSITRPHHGAQAFLCRSIMEQTGIDPYEVEYVEMHGTGTQAGDYNEMLSVSEVFAPENKEPRPSPLYVGAIKANIGHGEAAAGAMSLIKVLKMLEHNAIPPHVGIKNGIINQKFPKNLTARNLHIPMQLTHWPRHADGSPRLVFLNNFSAAGGNTAMLLQEGPQKAPPSTKDPRSHMVVSVSARSLSALKNNIRNLADYIATNPTTSLADLSYTTMARRITYNYRFACSAQGTAEVRRALEAAAEQDFRPVQPRKLAFAFTGQGAIYSSFARTLLEESMQFRSTLLMCEKFAKRQGFGSFMPVIDGSVSDLSALRPVTLQLATACVQIALVELLASWGIVPSAVVGHSIGEYAALYAAGVISASEVIHIVGSRAELMEKHCTTGSHAMLAVKGSKSSLSLAQYIDRTNIDIACENSPEETVLAGPQKSIDSLAETLSSRGIQSKKLEVTHAFHSSQMDAILSDLDTAANSLTFSTPKIPIISSLMGRVLDSDELNPKYLVHHARETVKFSAAVLDAAEQKIVDDKTIWIEIGSHPICMRMLKSTLGSETVGLASLHRSEDPWATLSSTLATLYNHGLSINWSEYHRYFDDSHRLLTLPSYTFDLKNYWIDYQNDWCLTKGDQVMPSTKEQHSANLPTPQKYFTLTVQDILEERVEDGTMALLGQSDISDPKLRKLILGHVVNGTGLCPAALYAEMALTLGDYMYKKSGNGTAPPGMNVCSLKVDKPLILKSDGSKPQLIRVSATLSDGSIQLAFYSVDGNGRKTVDHAACMVKYGDPQKWLDKWNKNSYLVHDQIKRLEAAVGDVSTHRLGRGMAYKLFSALVDYDESYRGMDDVVLNADAFDATAEVTFKSASGDGDYYMNPRWIDNLCHISGFIVNASEKTNSDEQVYISHGWESLRFGATIEHGKVYRSYARMMLSNDSDVRQGDVYIFDGDVIVGVAGGVKFQCLPRRLLNHLLPPVGKPSQAAAPQPGRDITAPSQQPALQSTAPAPVKRSKLRPESVTKPTKEPVATASSNVKLSSMKVLEIIAAECDLELGELTDSTAFEDLGVDSLLSLGILARLREELDVEVEGSLFIENPTIGDLKRFFDASSPEEVTEELFDSSNSSASHFATPSSTSQGSAVYDNSTPVNSMNKLSTMIRSLIATEVGVDMEQITDDTDLPSMGMDSLMSLSVTAAIREQTELNIPDDILIQCTTVSQVEQALGVTQPPPKTTSPNVSQPVITTGSQKPQPKALSFLIQGNPRNARETVFFFPDGSGSATSYAPIPPIGGDVCVYALNCPYMKTPEDFHCGIDGVTSVYLDEVKRRQPKGPYNFGGWSAGGVMAYEAAVQLQERGETVTRLILIDSPCPVALEPVPSKLFRFFDSMGVLGDRSKKASPPYLIPHFEAMIRNLDTYVARPFRRGTEPKVLAIWAKDGVCKRPEDPRPVREASDPKVMDWLLNNRTNFGPNGWDQLLAKESFTCVSMEGNHFSMMVDPLVKELGRLIRKKF